MRGIADETFHPVLPLNRPIGLQTKPTMLDAELVPAPNRDARNLMVVLHGLGDSIDGYRWLPKAMGFGWMNYLLVNAPDPYFGGFSWYDLTGDPIPGIVRSRAMLFELLDAQRRQGFPTEATTLFGFSQGCLMTWEMGFHYPHRFAGLVGVSGYAHEPIPGPNERSTAAESQRFLITHGTQDPLVPFAAVKSQVASIRKSGLHVQWHEFAKPHSIAGDEELHLIRHFVAEGYPPP